MKYGAKRYFIRFHKKSSIKLSMYSNEIWAQTITEVESKLRSQYGDNIVIEKIKILR